MHPRHLIYTSLLFLFIHHFQHVQGVLSHDVNEKVVNASVSMAPHQKSNTSTMVFDIESGESNAVSSSPEKHPTQDNGDDDRDDHQICGMHWTIYLALRVSFVAGMIVLLLYLFKQFE